jgi:hypothetical protein
MSSSRTKFGLTEDENRRVGDPIYFRGDDPGIDVDLDAPSIPLPGTDPALGGILFLMRRILSPLMSSNASEGGG